MNRVLPRGCAAGHGDLGARLVAGLWKGEHMNMRAGAAAALDGRMSLRAWARSRQVPPSTAYKAVQSGRITRDADGRLNPARADQEWMAKTRPRVDMRCPVVPAQPSDSGVASEPQPMSRAVIERRNGAPAPDPDAFVRVVVALTVIARLEGVLATELVSAVSGAILDIAPKLARPQDRAWLAERLYDALSDGWVSTETKWRRRYPTETPEA